MGGSTGSTTESIGQLFGTGGGYQQPNQVAPITQPQATTLSPTPEQAAAATQARMLARTPTMAAPAAAPKKSNDYEIQRGNGGGARGASSGGNGNGWSGR